MDDRDAILARRALLLSSALAAMSCSPPSQPVTTTSGTVTSSTSAGAPTSSASIATSARAVPPLAPWAEVVAKLPPRGVPSSVKAQEAAQLRQLESLLDERYRTLEEGWRSIPTCDPHDPSCRDAWRAAGDRMKKLQDLTRASITGGCGGLTGQTATIVARRDAHQRSVAELLSQLEAHLSAVAASMSALGEQDWQRLLSNAKIVPPMPCLSPCMRPELSDLLLSIGFAKDASQLDDPLKTLDRVKASVGPNFASARIVVRGHASSDEAKPDELARARSQVVFDALVKAGVPKSQLVLESFGTTYAATREPEGNRRVDFSVEATSPRAP